MARSRLRQPITTGYCWTRAVYLDGAYGLPSVAFRWASYCWRLSAIMKCEVPLVVPNGYTSDAIGYRLASHPIPDLPACPGHLRAYVALPLGICPVSCVGSGGSLTIPPTSVGMTPRWGFARIVRGLRPGPRLPLLQALPEDVGQEADQGEEGDVFDREPVKESPIEVSESSEAVMVHDGNPPGEPCAVHKRGGPGIPPHAPGQRGRHGRGRGPAAPPPAVTGRVAPCASLRQGLLRNLDGRCVEKNVTVTQDGVNVPTSYPGDFVRPNPAPG